MTFPITFQDPHVEQLATAILGKDAREPEHAEVRRCILRLLEKVYSAAVVDATERILDPLRRL